MNNALINPFHAIPAMADAEKQTIYAIVEIAKGEVVKYEYNKKFGMVMVDRVLKTPMPYPFSYGLIPSTWNDFDHDPLDIIILGKNSFHPGVMMECRVVGMLSVDDSGERDDKVLAIPVGDKSLSHITDVSDIDPLEMETMVYFMENYKNMEKKTVKVTGIQNAAVAKEFITECIGVYTKKFA